MIPPLRFEPPLLLDLFELVFAAALVVAPPVLAPRRAQRALADAASLARVAADIGRRRPSVLAEPPEADEELLPPLVLLLPPPLDELLLPPRLLLPKSDSSRASSDWICSRIETASFNFSNDRFIPLL